MDFSRKHVRLPKSATEKEEWQRVIVILEHCPLKSVHSSERQPPGVTPSPDDRRGHWELVSEKHRAYHRKHNEDPALWRPDVVHQSLLQLLDSPLNRAGKLQVFLRTKDGVCIEVDPRLRVPRCYRIFEKTMCRLLFKMKVRSSTGYLSLLKIVKNPITDHMPPNTRLIRVEKDGEFVDPFDLPALVARSARREVSENERRGMSAQELTSAAAEKKLFVPFAFIVGGMARGDVEAPYAEKDKVMSIRFGNRGLSAAAACSLICHAFEEAWNKEDDEAEDQ